jgi:hypothetical protein
MRFGQVRIELQRALAQRAHPLAADCERSRIVGDADPMHAGKPGPGRREIGSIAIALS